MRIFSGELRQKELIVPKNHDFRPTTSKVRMQVFNICQNMLEGSRVLDLFAGSGAIGFEAISRGAIHSTFVEKEKEAVLALHENIENLHLEKTCTVLPVDALLALQKLRPNTPFSLIYIDPPYDLIKTPYFDKIVMAIDQSSFLAPGGILFIESRKNTFKPTSFTSLSFKSNRTSGESELWQFEKVTPV